MNKRKDITGQRFGRLVAIEPHHIKNGIVHWVFRCDCGNTKVLSGTNVRAGGTKSCGCLKRDCLTKRNQSKRKHPPASPKTQPKKLPLRELLKQQGWGAK